MKSSDEKLQYNVYQHIVVWAIALLFMLFVTLLIPDKHRAIKPMLLLIGTPSVALVVYSSANARHIISSFGAWNCIIITGTVILLVPLIMTAVYYTHYTGYMNSIPSDNRVAFRITAEVKRTGSSGSIGNEWSYKHAINDTTFKSGEIVEVNISKPFTVTSTIIENDGIDDIGKTTSNRYRFQILSDYTKEITVVNKVKVTECGGRRNARAYATFSVSYSINRVLPPSFTFFDIYLFTDDDMESSLLWCVLLLELLSIYHIVSLIRSGKRKKLQLEVERKEEEERQLQTAKKVFIDSLKGKSLRDAAGVPPHIIYKNDQPVDNNNAEYGSFTVYLSTNGRCYHGSKGCCSAYRPVHFFYAKRNYRPCSKCYCRYSDIPEWHQKYLALKAEARKYGIEE